MAPRKRSSILTAEPVEEPASASKKRKQTKKHDSSRNISECATNNETKAQPKRKSTILSSSNKNTALPHSETAKAKPKRNSKKLSEKQEEKDVENMQVDSTPVEEMNIEQLLALGEQSQGITFSTNYEDDFDFVDDDDDDDKDFEYSSDSDMSDFEEVKNADVLEPVIPKEGVNITLDAPNLFNKPKKKGFDLEAHLKRQMNRVRRDLQLLMHKVHVLGWIAHLRFVNNTLNSPIVMEKCTSLIKSKNLYPSKYVDLSYLEGILKWFHKNVELKKDVDPLCTGGLLEELKYQIEKKQAFSSRAFIFIFIVLLRVLGLKARIVMSFQVLPVKPSLLELYGDVIKARSEKLKKSGEKPGTSYEKPNKKLEVPLENLVESESDKSKSRKCNDSKSLDQKQKGKSKKDIEKSQVEGKNSDDEFVSEHFKPVSKSKKNSKLKQSAKESGDVKSSSKSKTKRSNVVKKKEVKSDENEDNDFTPVSLLKKSNKKKILKKSPNTSEESQKKKEGSDVWTEVYLEAEEKWISVDVPRQKIHCIGELYVRASHPVAYILGCNNDHTLKDVTKRYVPNWHSDTRKKRVDEEWWNDTMKPYLPPKTTQDREEDEDINRQLVDKPLPSSISEFKDHPLYALKRHLLKFEAIYPPDAPTLGFVRGEPVYARECVHTLHSREMWYKQARLVRLKEEPYKIVKARPKYDKMTGEFKKDLPLELYGRWQTEDYIPPVARDGKVPRNEYGNVDLFKPCMLPIGTVHLQIPALNRIAKKLDIDCAPATVGFDFHSGGSHPVFDGFVVCEEFKDILLDAWNKEIDESSKKEAEKKDKRVYGNWKRLIRGLLIREKLKIKYAFGENSDEESDPKPLANKASTSRSSEKR